MKASGAMLSRPANSAIRRCQPLLGTLVEIHLAGARSERELLALSSQAFAQIRQIDALLSFHRVDSELSRVNATALHASVAVSEHLSAVLSEALWLSQISDGLFDPSVAPQMVALGLLPDHGLLSSAQASWRDLELRDGQLRFARPLQLDLGGIAKGYAVDLAMQALPDDVQACINAGGDLRMHPWAGQEAMIRLPTSAGQWHPLPMRDAALASSIGCLGSHLGAIIDPRTGRASADARSFSVFAATAMRADGLTKIACLQPDCADLMEHAGAQMLIVDGLGRLNGNCQSASGVGACP